MRHKSSGFTLIEMIITIVVIGVGLAGLIVAFTTTMRSSADPMVRKQLIAVAEAMMEEITLKPYAIGPGARSGCDRRNVDDIRDYAGYSAGVCTPDGVANANLSAYTVQVDVSASPITWNAVPETLRIKVTVTDGARESFSLVTWRTNYAVSP
jgi:MSHA pilin protein MshD